MGRDITEIASLFIGVALVALLVGHAQGASTVIGAVSSGFGNLLNIVELNPSSGFSTPFQSAFGSPLN